MIGRWHNVHTDIGHDSIPSRISVCTYISYIHIHIYTKGRTMHVSNLIKPESFENQSPSPPSLLLPETAEYSAEHPVISRRIQSRKAKEREIFTRELPCHTTRIALPRTLPLLPSSPREDARMVRLIFLRGHLFRLPGTGSRR